VDPKGANLLGDLLEKEVEKYHAKSVVGLESGAIQSSSVVYNSFGKKRNGQKRIEGYLIKPVVVVEDVISVMQAIEAIREERVKYSRSSLCS
jgi:orotate phosphoribosyltransferase